MRSPFLFFLFTWVSTFIWCQEVQLDSVSLNIQQQVFSQSELYTETPHFDSIVTKNESISEISLSVDVLDSTYFLLRSNLLKNDTVTKVSRSGHQRKIIYTGMDYVLGNRLFINNFTDSSVIVPIEDDRLVLVQEAVDPEGNWKPIEYFIHSGCGMSYSGFRIPSKMCYEMMIVKYSGNFKTKLRVRAMVGKQMYISNEFDGSINLGQFQSPEWVTSKGEANDYLFNQEAYKHD